MSFFRSSTPTEVNAAYLTARMVGILGTGFCSGAMLSTAYFTMPGLFKSNSSASEAAKAFYFMSGRSAAWLNRMTLPATIAFSYAAYYAPSHPTDWVNPRTLLSSAAIAVGFVFPYHYFKMSGPGKRLSAGGESVEINEEKHMGLQVVDDEMVKSDLKDWTGGNKLRGWFVLFSFVVGSYVEVFYLK